jgi:polyisoprenoid-binding protein YceI
MSTSTAAAPTTPTAATTGAAGGQTVWKIDPSHSVVEFAVKHMMFATVKGRFAAFAGEVVTHPDDPTEGSVSFSIDADSIDTRDEKRDEHLRSNDFFGAGDHPKLVFTSTRVEHVPGPTFKVHGDLTIKGVTRPVVLDATFNGSGVNPWGQTVASWSATTEIDREEWGMTFNSALEAGGVLVGTTVKVGLELEAARLG